jgi:hypothetical protein
MLPHPWLYAKIPREVFFSVDAIFFILTCRPHLLYLFAIREWTLCKSVAQ